MLLNSPLSRLSFVMKLYLLIVLAVAFSSCKFDQQSAEQEQQVQYTRPTEPQQVAESGDTVGAKESDSQRPYVDSFRIEMDSLMAANIQLPPIYKHEIVSANDNAAARFTDLAKATGGKIKILVNSTLVAKEVMHTINSISKPQSDLLILIDKTGSMGNDIQAIKHSMGQIIDTIKKYKGTRVAVATYGDKNVDGFIDWYTFKNFETNYAAAREYIDKIQVGGGGDWPESVYDAVMNSFENEFWQSTTKRNIILVGDAPPLEKPLSDYTLNDVVAASKKGGVIMNFYPIIITPAAEEAKIEKSELVTYQPIKLTTSLYPNPSKGIVNIGFEENGAYYIEIYNSAGQMIVSEEAYGISWTKDLSDMPDGMYIARIINATHKFELQKFILRH